MEQELGEVHGWPRIEIINIKYAIIILINKTIASWKRKEDKEPTDRNTRHQRDVGARKLIPRIICILL